MNWLTTRKKETIYQVLVGGEPIPAQANQDGTANTLDSDPKTGEDGSTNTWANNSLRCWRRDRLHQRRCHGLSIRQCAGETLSTRSGSADGAGCPFRHGQLCRQLDGGRSVICRRADLLSADSVARALPKDADR